MRDCAYEASVALSAYGRLSKGHTALTSEAGTMLEEVLQYLTVIFFLLSLCSLFYFSSKQY